MDHIQLRDSIERELDGNLLPFWRERSFDHRGGGFVAEMALDGTIGRETPRGLILNARLLWTFSALYRERGDVRDLLLARRAYAYIEGFFRDRRHGGYMWRLGPDGSALDRTKKIYGQAFCIFALSEYYRATGEDGALRSARSLFDAVERYAYDPRFGGYIEVLAEDWSESKDLRLGDQDMDVAKSMNNHLHLLEAYTNLYRVWRGALVADRLRELISLFGRRLRAPSGHFNLFFDGDWKIRSDSYTYGHDIEGAWLLYEAAETLGDAALLDTVSGWGIETAHSVAEEALDPEGGLAYEGRNGIVIDPGRVWWAQAEAVLGFWHAYRITGDERYAGIAARLWDFILNRIVDRRGGEWFWAVLADGTVDPGKPKISEWKDPYHGVRMCLKMLHFLGD